VSFHDAEVHAIRVDRAGPTLELDVEAFAQTPRALRYHLRFLGVTDLELEDVNEQNVLFDLTAAAAPDGWHVRLVSTYGLDGSFTCRSIEFDTQR
jgi:hypothetical protein